MLRQTLLAAAMTVIWLFGCKTNSSPSPVDLTPYDFTYEQYSQLLRDHVSNDLVDYGAIKSNRGLLDSLVDRVGSADLSHTSEAERLAFYINAYNIITIRSIVDAYPVGSIRDIDGVWDKKRWLVGGEMRTLNEIEYEILRKDFTEPRIHVAINCASIGCPPLLEVPYRPDRLDSLLAISSQRFAISRAHNDIDFDKGIARLSAIFDWFGDDFVKPYYAEGRFPGLEPKLAAALIFLMDNLPTDSAVKIDEHNIRVEFLDYDWSLNDFKH